MVFIFSNNLDLGFDRQMTKRKPMFKSEKNLDVVDVKIKPLNLDLKAK